MRKEKFLHVDQLPKLYGVKYEAVTTKPLEKFGSSFINAIITLGLSVPFLIYLGPTMYWRISVIVIFALYETYMFVFLKDRCFGMKIMDTYWRSHYTFWQHVRFNIFYTMSFATIMFYIWFPLDLLLINLLFIQLPMSLITGTTLHGYLSGMHTVKIVAK